jgi:hypothetical protein
MRGAIEENEESMIELGCAYFKGDECKQSFKNAIINQQLQDIKSRMKILKKPPIYRQQSASSSVRRYVLPRFNSPGSTEL